VLAVDVANDIVQQPLVSSGVVFAACVKAGDAHFVISKFRYCCRQRKTSTSQQHYLFVIFCPFCCGLV